MERGLYPLEAATLLELPARTRPGKTKERWNQHTVSFLAEDVQIYLPDWLKHAQDEQQWEELVDRYASFMEQALQ